MDQDLELKLKKVKVADLRKIVNKFFKDQGRKIPLKGVTKPILIDRIIKANMDYSGYLQEEEDEPELAQLKDIVNRYFKKQKRKISLKGITKPVIIDLIDTIINKKPE
jgi:hypothetical protein